MAFVIRVQRKVVNATCLVLSTQLIVGPLMGPVDAIGKKWSCH